MEVYVPSPWIWDELNDIPITSRISENALCDFSGYVRQSNEASPRFSLSNHPRNSEPLHEKSSCRCYSLEQLGHVRRSSMSLVNSSSVQIIPVYVQDMYVKKCLHDCSPLYYWFTQAFGSSPMKSLKLWNRDKPFLPSSVIFWPTENFWPTKLWTSIEFGTWKEDIANQKHMAVVVGWYGG